MTTSKNERLSASFDELLDPGLDLASLKAIKAARAAEFIATKTVEAGARLIAANIELSHASNYPDYVTKKLSQVAAGPLNQNLYLRY